jgi:hypothetical protein
MHFGKIKRERERETTILAHKYSTRQKENSISVRVCVFALQLRIFWLNDMTSKQRTKKRKPYKYID